MQYFLMRKEISLPLNYTDRMLGLDRGKKADFKIDFFEFQEQ